MMVNKLAALFAILGTLLLIGTWMMRYGAGLGVMTADQLLFYALCCLVGYFIFGIVVARVSIGLIDEILSEMRSRQARARSNMGQGVSLAVVDDQAPASTDEKGKEPSPAPSPNAGSEGKG